MSWDLMVFEPAAAPRTRAEFDEWYGEQLGEGHGYNDPAVTSPSLRAWFEEIRKEFPPMNGPLAMTDREFDSLTPEEENRVTDYSIGKSVIYMAFAWSVADKSEAVVRKLARKHKIGFYIPESGEAQFFDGQRRFDLSTNGVDKQSAEFIDIWIALDRLKEVRGEFVTIEQKPAGKALYMQAIYDKGVYRVELQIEDSDDAMPRYSREVADFRETLKIFRDWFVWDELPALADWNDAQISPPAADRENGRTNKLIKAFILVVAAAVIIGGVAYIAKDFF